MRLFTYKMVRDYGFAPNPFDGVCTLATCKPDIRKAAEIGDIVIACGSVKNGFDGRIICAFRVTGKGTFQQYWDDPAFNKKRPSLNTSVRRAYGDNIYHHGIDGNWLQENSHHSLPDGGINELNLAQDTSSDNVLSSTDFIYWGREAPPAPVAFNGFDLSKVRRGRSHFEPAFIDAVEVWFCALEQRGRLGRPIDWR